MSQAQEGRALARELVNQVAKEKGVGVIPESSLERMPQQVRREVEEALLAKDKRIGASVLTLAKSIYTSNARFAFELLQNADDNKYDTARRAGQDPFVAFKVHPDKIIVDNNEDGFTEDDLRAICDVGKSTKAGSYNHIGEEGIGFKAVFMVAWKVHIQSGDFSFSFIHRQGDSGIGMVTPIWEEPQEELPRPLTRITLFLHERLDSAGYSHTQDAVPKQLRDLQGRVLLFLRNIKRMGVVFYDDQGHRQSGTLLTMCDAEETIRVIVESSPSHGPIGAAGKQIYHVTKHTVTHLPKSENRTASESDESNESYTNSEIILAFPLTETSEPIIKTQDVFAFLPIRKVGFNFVIHADFDTESNGLHVIMDSPRNQRLVDGIGEAFKKTALQFCTHESLQYSWMRYLPLKSSFQWEPLWGAVVDRITELLQDEQVLRTRGQGVLRSIKQLRLCPTCDRDEDGQPLFADLDPELYLSDSYTNEDVEILLELGLEELNMSESIHLVEKDLESSSSRLQGPDMTSDWHSRVASLLSLPFENEQHQHHEDKVRSLNIIPLIDGSWASADHLGSIFYPEIDGVPIPADLGFALVHPSAVTDSNREALFDHLGVQPAKVSKIRASIHARYEGNTEHLTFAMSMEHLRFLYLTHRPKDEWDHFAGKPLGIYNHEDTLELLRHASRFYILDSEFYGPRVLSGTAKVAKLGISFVSPKYFEQTPEQPSNVDLTWSDWMHEYVRVRRYVPLVDSWGLSLTEEAQYLAKIDPTKFLCCLKHSWSWERVSVTHSKRLLLHFRRLHALCLNGRGLRLSETYLPLPALQDVCQRFIGVDDFPFLRLPTMPVYGGTKLLSDWGFLTEHLGVGYKDDLDFRLRLVSCMQESTKGPSSQDMPLRVSDLYLYIQAACMESQDSEPCREQIETFFEERACVWIPGPNSASSDKTEWLPPSQCLWEASDDLINVKPLKSLYQTSLSNHNSGIDRIDELAIFFRKTLRIPNMTYGRVIEDIKAVKREHDLAAYLERIYQLYRSRFEEDELVCVDRNGSATWHRPTECVWPSTPSLEKKVAINVQDSDLQEFFLDILGVQYVNSRMVYDSLLDISSGCPSVERVKDLLRALNSLLISDDDPPAPSDLLECHVFPVKAPDRDTTLCSAQTEFAIIDRKDLFNIFRDRAKFFDFSLEEACQLKPLIDLAGLGGRYLSGCVEISSRIKADIVEWPVAERDRDLRTKAYGLLRIAAKYSSPRFDADSQSLYDLLRNIETVEVKSTSIWSTLTLEQGGEIYKSHICRGGAHLEEKDGSLKVYVPREADKQDVCFRTELPRRMVSWLMMPPGADLPNNLDEAAVNIVNVVLNCRISAMSSILTREGIPEVRIFRMSEERAASTASTGQCSDSD